MKLLNIAANSDRDIMCRHLQMKKELPEKWFEVNEIDFSGTPPQAIAEIRKNKTWLERRYLMINYVYFYFK